MNNEFPLVSDYLKNELLKLKELKQQADMCLIAINNVRISLDAIIHRVEHLIQNL